VLGLGGLISANLAVVNLMPVPPFDGFYVLVVGWEAVTRRRVNEQIRHTLVAAGFIVIVCVFFALTFKDIVNLWRYGTP
jgi:regulator of sigma E protease